MHNQQLLWILVGACGFLVGGQAHNTTHDCSPCILSKHTAVKTAALEKLKPLCGNTYKVSDGEYTYDVGICVNVGTNEKMEKVVGVQQKKIKTPTEIFALGNINEADIMTGENWMYLEYQGGQKYGNACNKEHRRAIVMITCSKGDYEGTLSMLEEDTNKTSECHYLFGLSHDAVCVKDVTGGLTAGGVICIVFFSIAGAYLIFGGLYMRCMKGAKGWKQIPNYEFWKDFGNLQADGCDLICRCGRRDLLANHYHGIGDHQIESANDDERDEHLLPM